MFSPEMFTAILQSSVDGILTIDREQKIVQFNCGAERLFGYQQVEVIGSSISRLIPEHVRAVHETHVARRLQTIDGSRQVERLQTVMGRRSSGVLFPLEGTITHFKQDGDSYFTAIVRDVSDRLKAEEETRNREELLTSLIEGIDQVVTLVTFDSPEAEPKYAFISGQTTRRIGRSPQELLSNIDLYFQQIHPDDIESVRASHHRIRKNKAPEVFIYRMKNVEGNYRWLERTSTLKLDDAGNVTKIFSITADITDRIDVLEQLRKSELLYRSLVQGISEITGITVIDPLDLQTRFEFVSEQVFDVLGYRPEQFIADPMFWGSLAHPEDRSEIAALLERMLQDGKSFTADARFRHASGDYRWLRTQVIPDPDRTGRVMRHFSISRDITEERIADDRRISIEVAERANKAKSEFLSRMSHELRTPLNAILGFAQILSRDCVGSAREGYVAPILVEGKRLLKLVDQVLEIVQLDAGQLQLFKTIFDIGEVMEAALDSMESEGSTAVPYLSPQRKLQGPILVKADRQRTQEVLRYLLMHAVHNSNIEDKIWLGYERKPIDGFRITIGGWGKTLSSDRLQKLFSPFERLSMRNEASADTGLSFTLARRLAEEMKCQLGVSGKDDGTKEFWLDIQAIIVPTIDSSSLDAYIDGGSSI